MALKSTLAKRIIFGLVMSLALVALILVEGYLSCHSRFMASHALGGAGFVLLVIAFVGAGSIELLRMARARNVNVRPVLMVAAVAVVSSAPLWAAWLGLPAAESLAAVLLAGLLVAAAIQARTQGTAGSLSNLAALCLGTVYLGLGGYFIVLIRLLGASAETTWGQVGPVVMFVACVKSCDIGAYFTGRFLGRHKWVPRISPAKTWEGLGGGILLAMIAASLFALLSGIMPYGNAILFGLVVAVAGQLGDILESMLKRDLGVKDSASLVPVFGGVLDMLDSPVVAAPFAYFIFCWSL